MASTGPGQCQGPGAPSQCPTWVTAAQALEPSLLAFPQELDHKQPGHTPAFIQDVGAAGFVTISSGRP